MSWKPVSFWPCFLSPSSEKSTNTETMSRKTIKRTNIHHRRSRSRTGGKKYNGEILGIPNVIRVDYRKHQSFHHLFPDTHPQAIAEELNTVWIDPAYVMLAVPRNIARQIIRSFNLYHRHETFRLSVSWWTIISVSITRGALYLLEWLYPVWHWASIPLTKRPSSLGGVHLPSRRSILLAHTSFCLVGFFISLTTYLAFSISLRQEAFSQ